VFSLSHLGHFERFNNQCNHSFELFPLTPNQTHGALHIGQRIAKQPNIKPEIPIIMPVDTRPIKSALLSTLARPMNIIVPPNMMHQNARLAFHHCLVFLIIDSLNTIIIFTHNIWIKLSIGKKVVA